MRNFGKILFYAWGGGFFVQSRHVVRHSCRRFRLNCNKRKYIIVRRPNGVVYYRKMASNHFVFRLTTTLVWFDPFVRVCFSRRLHAVFEDRSRIEHFYIIYTLPVDSSYAVNVYMRICVYNYDRLAYR